MNHKTTFYSLEECKNFMQNISSDIKYSENEGVLTACFHYLREYESELVKMKPRLFTVQCIESVGMFDLTTVNAKYGVIEESDTQYTIIDDYGGIGKYQKTKFIRLN